MHASPLVGSIDWHLYANVATCLALVGLCYQIWLLMQTTWYNATQTLRTSLAHLNEITADEPKTPKGKEVAKCIHRLNYFQAIQDAHDYRLIPDDEWKAQQRYIREVFIAFSAMEETWFINRDIYTEKLMATLDPYLRKELQNTLAKGSGIGKRRKFERLRSDILEEYTQCVGEPAQNS